MSLLSLFKRKPDFTIGRSESLYMRRWYIIPRNRFFNIYLHNMLRDDEDHLHDHPWWNVSVILKGGYWEWTPQRPMTRWEVVQWATPLAEKLYRDFIRARKADRYQMPVCDREWRPPGKVIFRRATDAHRLVLDGATPSWSLFITGRNVRRWGFWCPQGWVEFSKFVRKTEDGNERGAGCG
jgi:hypothetical protein